MATLEDALAEATRNGRVCPLPARWMELYELIEPRESVDGKWEPGVPPILAVWSDVPPLFKMLALQKHLEWAASHGRIEQAYAFLSKLAETEWHHLNSD